MWVYFNKNGQLITSLEHGSPARVGSTDFSIFAVVEGIDETNITNYSGVIRFIKPDLRHTEYPVLLMNTASATFEKLEGEGHIEPFEDGKTYYGFLFDFDDFDSSSQEEYILLDTNGLWNAIITLISTNQNDDIYSVKGVCSFNVAGVGSEDATQIPYNVVTTQLVAEINKRALKSEVILVINATPDISLYEDGQMFYRVDRNKFYKLVVDGQQRELVEVSIGGGSGLTVPTFDAQFVDPTRPEFEDFQLTQEDLNDIWANKYPLINIRVTIEDEEQTTQYIICFKLSQSTVNEITGEAMVYDMTSMEFSNDNGHQYDLDCKSFVIALDEGLPYIAAVNEEYYTNRFDRLKNIPALPTNLENGAGTNAVQQKMADSTVDFTGRNPNAEALDPTISTTINTGASGSQSSAFGKNTMARATAATAMGNKCLADAEESLSQGYQCVTLRGADGSHAQGNETTSGGKCAHSEGLYTQAMEDESHSEGNSTATYAKWGHSEGVFTTVKGNYIITTHDVDPSPIPPEPVTPTPTPEELDALNGVGAHSEGHYNFSFGLGSHTEGHGNKGYARFSRAEGGSNQAGPDLVLRKTEDGKDYYTIDHTKQYQHASGYQTKAIGTASYTGGWGTIAGYDFQTAIGKWNANKQDTLFEVGNGADDNNRGNAFEVHGDGRATIGAAPINDMDVVNKGSIKTVNGQSLVGVGNSEMGLFMHIVILSNNGYFLVFSHVSEPWSPTSTSDFAQAMVDTVSWAIKLAYFSPTRNASFVVSHIQWDASATTLYVVYLAIDAQKNAEMVAEPINLNNVSFVRDDVYPMLFEVN